MVCRGLSDCLLKLLNFLLSLVGYGGYEVFLFVEWKRVSHDDKGISPVSDNAQIIEFGRPLLIAVSLSEGFLDKLPKTCYRSVHECDNLRKDFNRINKEVARLKNVSFV
ncbi:hypothetical protein Sjap_023081 [Stephania japonica]|uniref:Uncharacterized protein n=1 Tax=Stephania japonica TaxID=461633 RepID=A0AAP0EYW2_9MAGN